MGIGVCGGIEGGRKYKNTYKGGWVGERSTGENIKKHLQGWVGGRMEPAGEYEKHL